MTAVPVLCADCHAHARCLDGKCVCEEGYGGNGNVCEGIYKICFLKFEYSKRGLSSENLSPPMESLTLVTLLNSMQDIYSTGNNSNFNSRVARIFRWEH